MRQPGGSGLPRRRVLTAPRLVLIGAAVAVVTVAVIATVSSAGGSPNPTSSTGTVQSQLRQGTVSRTSGSSGVPGSDPAPSLAPAGNRVQDVLRGEGGLVYRCSAGKYTLAQTSIKLFIDNGGFAGTQTEPLTWRFKNGTRVDAALVRQVPSRKTVSQALFKVVSVHGGDANDRATTFIARLPNSGGLPPATCATTGQRLFVPLTTRYVFYRSALPPAPVGAPTKSSA